MKTINNIIFTNENWNLWNKKDFQKLENLIDINLQLKIKGYKKSIYKIDWSKPQYWCKTVTNEMIINKEFENIKDNIINNWKAEIEESLNN